MKLARFNLKVSFSGKHQSLSQNREVMDVRITKNTLTLVSRWSAFRYSMGKNASLCNHISYYKSTWPALCPTCYPLWSGNHDRAVSQASLQVRPCYSLQTIHLKIPHSVWSFSGGLVLSSSAWRFRVRQVALWVTHAVFCFFGSLIYTWGPKKKILFANGIEFYS